MSTFTFPIGAKGYTFKRVDKGQDFQTTPGTPLVAVVSGTLSAGNDPSGFGPRYPILHGDDGRSYYYGHVDLPTILVGKHVQAGTVIAKTGAPRGNATSPGWFEFGDASLLGRGGETGGGPIAKLLHSSAPKTGGGGVLQTVGHAVESTPLGAAAGAVGSAVGAAGGAAGSLGIPTPDNIASSLVGKLADSLGAHAARILLYMVLVGGAAALLVSGLARTAGVTGGDVAKAAAVAVPK